VVAVWTARCGVAVAHECKAREGGDRDILPESTAFL